MLQDYVTNLAPLTCGELIQFFEEDWKSAHDWPFAKEDIIDFFQGDNDILRGRS